jgi:hypothetical protein
MPQTRMFRDRVVSMEQTLEGGEKNLEFLKTLCREAFPEFEFREHLLDHERDLFLMRFEAPDGRRKTVGWTRMVLFDPERLPALVGNPDSPLKSRLLAFLQARVQRPEIVVTFRHLEDGWVDTPEPRREKRRGRRGGREGREGRDGRDGHRRAQAQGQQPQQKQAQQAAQAGGRSRDGAPGGREGRRPGRPGERPGGREAGASVPASGREPQREPAAAAARPGAPPGTGAAGEGAAGDARPGGRRRRFRRRRRGRGGAGPGAGASGGPAPSGGSGSGGARPS